MKAVKNTQKELTGTNLKNALWDTLNGVMTRKVSPEVGNSVAAQSREIMRIIKAEIAVAKLHGKKPSIKLLQG